MSQYFCVDRPLSGRFIIRRDTDGVYWWLAEREHDLGYLEWLDAGNSPAPLDEEA